jgi:2-octaprenyl-6-methoxyphenol hydroxylase
VTKNYQQNGIVCTISHEKHHLGTAQERFLDAGPFAVLPMKGGYHSSLVWVEPSDYVDLYMKMSDEDLSEEVARRIGGDYLGQVSVTGKRFSYPLSMVHAQRYHDKRLIIIGDAAHGMHPLAGQGFNVGIRDAQALHGLIQEQREWGGDIGSLSFLERYTRARNFDASSMIAATDGLDALFSTSSYPIALARRFGMKTLNHVPAVKKYFIRQAMGINQ